MNKINSIYTVIFVLMIISIFGCSHFSTLNVIKSRKQIIVISSEGKGIIDDEKIIKNREEGWGIIKQNKTKEEEITL